MPQGYTDNVFQGSNVVSTNLASANTNLMALRTCFSGDNAPSDPDPGQWWYDTTNNILKLRNDTSTWSSVWDFANNCPVLSGLASVADAKKITLAMMDAASKSTTLAPTTAGLRAIGETAYTACAGNDSRLLNTEMAVGNVLIGRHDIENGALNTSYVRLKGFTILQAGNYRMDFAMKSSKSGSTAYGQIYKNGVAAGAVRSTTSTSYGGPFTENINDWAKGDECTLSAKSNGTDIAYVENFRLYVTTSTMGVPIISY